MSKKSKKNVEMSPKQGKCEEHYPLKIVIERCKTPTRIINGMSADSMDESSSDSWSVRRIRSTRENLKKAKTKQDKDPRTKSAITISDESESDDSGRCSPIIPRTEPSMRWCGLVDENNKLIVTKVSLEPPKKMRTPLKNLAQENSPLRVGRQGKQGSSTKPLDEDSENEIPNKRKVKGVSKSGKNHERKLNDDDISRLLEEDEEDDDGDISKLFEDDEDEVKEETSKPSTNGLKESQKSLKTISMEVTCSPLKKSSLARTDNNPYSPRLKALKEKTVSIVSSPKSMLSPQKKPLADIIDKIPNSPRLRERVLVSEMPSPKSKSVIEKLPNSSRLRERILVTEVQSPKSNNLSKYAVVLSAKKKLSYEDDGSTTTNEKSKIETPKQKISKEPVLEEMDEEVIMKSKTPRRRKRIESSSDSEPEVLSNKKRFKPCDPATPKEITPLMSLRKRKPNLKYDDEWETPSPSPVKKYTISKDYNQSKKSFSTTRTVEASPRTPKSVLKPSTPVSRKGSARLALLTPSMPVRTSNVASPGNVLEEARARLHVSAVPKSLPCREKEFQNIYRFLQGKILDGLGGCMYISGVPGTGKTATVQEVVRSLRGAVSCGDIPDFQFIELNGMRLTEPRQAYVQLLKQLTGQTMAAEQAQQLLERRFSRSAKKNITTLLLVDELDLLWTRRQDVVYNLLDWPTKASSHLVVLTIANTMDLPERILMGRVTSRLGLTRVTFHPYSHKQLQEIVLARLGDLEAFDPDAVQLVARKVAAVSGDARRALDICRRAAELAEMEVSNRVVEMKHVDQALEEMVASSTVQAIRFCSKMEQVFLQAVTAEVQRTGVEETIFNKVYIQLRTLCTFDGLSTPSITEALGLCARLGSCRLLLTEHSRNDIHQRVLLNVSCDDIHYALKVK